MAVSEEVLAKRAARKAKRDEARSRLRTIRSDVKDYRKNVTAKKRELNRATSDLNREFRLYNQILRASGLHMKKYGKKDKVSCAPGRRFHKASGKCKYGRKVSGGCKKKPGPKRG